MDQEHALCLAFKNQMLAEAEMLLNHERFEAPDLDIVVRLAALLIICQPTNQPLAERNVDL